MRLRAILTPSDTSFFSDGRPFNASDEGVSRSASVFPPRPHQLAACVRVAIAEQAGAPGASLRRWDPGTAVAIPRVPESTLADIVGDGDCDLGVLRFSNIRIRAPDRTAYLPCPHSILQIRDHSEPSIFKHSMSATNADLEFSDDLSGGSGASAFGDEESTRLDLPQGWLLSEASFAEILASPDKVIGEGDRCHLNKVFLRENYVGQELSPSKANLPGRLYSVSHLRPLSDSRNNRSGVAIDVQIDASNASASWLASELAERTFKGVLGGRGRSVRISFEQADASDIDPPDWSREDRVRLYATAPLIIGTRSLAWLRGAAGFLGVEGCRLVSAAHDRPARLSMWRGDRGGRSAWTWSLEAGAVFEIELEDENAAERLSARLADCGLNMLPEHDARRFCRLGFGDVAVGRAP